MRRTKRKKGKVKERRREGREFGGGAGEQ